MNSTSLISVGVLSVTVTLPIVLSSSVVPQPALKVRLVWKFVIVRFDVLTSTVHGRPLAVAVDSSQPLKVPKPVGHFLVSQAVIFAVLPPSVVIVAWISQDIP